MCKTPSREVAAAASVLVNFEYPFIFNGVFEMQKSTRKAILFEKMRALGA
jgi:hypothetical protein